MGKCSRSISVAICHLSEDSKREIERMDIDQILSHFENRKQFWDDFEKKYAKRDLQQMYENHDYGILEFHKYWPDDIPQRNLNTKNNCHKQKNGEEEAVRHSSSVQSSLDCLYSTGDICSAKIDSNQHSEEKREQSERTCNSPTQITEKSDIQINKTAVKCSKQVNKIPVKRISKAEMQSNQICAAKLPNNTAVKIQHKSESIQSTLPDKNRHQVHTDIAEGDLKLSSGDIRPTNTAIDAPIAAQSESEKITVKIKHKSERIKSPLPDKNQHQIHTDITESDLKLSSGNIRPTSTAVDAPIAAQSESEKITVKIKHKSDRIKSTLPDKNQYQMHTDIKEGDLKLPVGNIRPTFSGTVKTNERAPDRNCINIKHSRQNINGIAGHIMEDATTFGVAETAEVQPRYIRTWSKLGKEGDVFTRNKNYKDSCTHSVCKNIPLDEAQSKSCTEPVRVKDNLDRARESCSSSDIPNNGENVITQKRPNKSTIHRSKNTDSSASTCTSTTPHSSKSSVPDKTEIIEKQANSVCNKSPQVNRIARVPTLSTAMLNDSFQTGKNSIKAVLCASATESVSSDILLIHQKSSKLSSTVENDNDLQVKHKNDVIMGKSPNKSMMHRPENIDASDYTIYTSATQNSSENAVSNMIQILESQTKRESNEIPQTNRIAIASTMSTATQNDAVQTEKRNTNAAIGAFIAKSASNNIMHIHQISSRESSLLENDNDLHVIHKSKCSSNSLQRNEKEASTTNIHKTNTKHKAFMVLLHGNTATSSTSFCSKNNHETSEKENNPFNDKFIQKSSVDRTGKVLLQDKMAQSAETTEKRCGNRCLAKRRLEEEYTSYSTVDMTANAIEDVLEKLRRRSKNSFRKRSTRMLKQVLSSKAEQQVLQCSLSKLRNLSATERQDDFTNRNEELDINNEDIWTSLNNQNTNKLVTAEDAIRKNNQRQKQRRWENTKKREANDESSSRSTDSIAVHLAVLDISTCNDNGRFIEGKQKSENCISERLHTQNKTPVELISQSCPFNHDENCLQSESPHSIKTASEKQNMVAKILECDSEDKPLTEANRKIKSTTNNEIMKQLYENVSEKNTKCLRNSSPGKQVEENHSSNFDHRNNECIIQVPLTDSSLGMNNSVIKYKSKKLDICRSKAEFCESNEINSCKHNSNKLADAESTVKQRKHQHMETQRLEKHKRINSDVRVGLVVSKSGICCESNCFEIQSLHSKSSIYERMNDQNKSLEKPPFSQIPCLPRSRKKCTRNTNEAHNVAPLTLENGGENLTNGSFINSSIRYQLHHEFSEQDILRNKSVQKEIRRNLSSKTDKQNKGNINKESMKSFASQIKNSMVSEQHAFTTEKLEHSDILEEMNRYKISDNNSNVLCATQSRNMHKETQARVKTKRRKLNNIAPASDAEDGARVNLAVVESSFCSNSDSSEIWQLQNKYSGRPHTQSITSNKPLSQLQFCTFASVESQSNCSSSDCIASDMLTNFNSESWTTFTSRVINDLQSPLPKINKPHLLCRK